MNFNTVNARIINWNSARYEQEFNKQLQYDLLFSPTTGEVQEWHDAVKAGDEVEQLDALCDIYFVAIGGLWKLGFELEAIRLLLTAAIQLENGNTFERALEYWRTDDYHQSFACIIVAAMHLAIGMGLSGLQFLRAINAVCDSNDTKPIVKTASNVKANVDKGVEYVPPTEALKAILAEVHHG
jgi:NTP pyrophosphatase (non-canonical NTP hydrolase)